MNEDAIGALWEKQGQKGLYYTGTITVGDETLKVVAFLNKDKKNPKQPDIRILQSKPREESLPNDVPF